MSKGQSPLLGYNTNVRHKGKVFHIQTEDSGVGHPHVITHLFADGGRIVKSTKTSYAELLNESDMQPRVKKLMQEQHKAMFIALRDGTFDAQLELDAPGPSAKQTGAHPAVRPSTAGQVAVAPPLAPKPTEPSPAPVASAAPASSITSAVPPAAASPAPAIASTSPPMPQPVRRPSSANTPAAAPPSAVSSARPTEEVASADGSGASAAVSARSGKYAPVRSPEILSSFRHRSEGSSIFGEDLMSEKSLDEVILAYLSEDLDDKKR